MKFKVTEQGVLIPKELLGDSQENNALVEKSVALTDAVVLGGVANGMP